MLGLIVERQELADFYAMCDVFALPSRTNCFPSVQIEAMMCGTPVVATNIPGAREVVRVTGMGRPWGQEGHEGQVECRSLQRSHQCNCRDWIPTCVKRRSVGAGARGLMRIWNLEPGASR